MKWVLTGLAVVAAWLIAVALWIGVGPGEDGSETADVAIVLGAAVVGDQPTPVFAARIDHAIALYKTGRVKALLFTGARSPEDTLSEASSARAYAIKAGVLPDDILIEENSRTTRQNLVEAQLVMRANSKRHAIIVSDPVHLRRASLMADDLGIDASSSATPSTRYQSWSTKGPFLLRELYFVHHFWVFGE